MVVGKLAFGVVDFLELEEHAEEVGLPAEELPARRRLTATAVRQPMNLRLMISWVWTSSW